MTGQIVSHRSDSAQESLRTLGVLSCEFVEFPAEAPVPNEDMARVVETTAGKRLLVSVPDGLRSPCFRLTLPEQREIALMVIDDVEGVAGRIVEENPPKGTGTAANQSASLVNKIKQIAESQRFGQQSLYAEQRVASMQAGAVPAFFRYEDPHGNVIRVFNPRDSISSWRQDGIYTGETDIRPEGCHSSLQFRGQVTRPIIMAIDGEDLDGRIFRVTARGPAARLVGHEVSHVNRGIAGLCIIEEGLPVIPLEEYRRMGSDVTDWSYSIDFTSTNYLEFTDPEGRLHASVVTGRLIEQGLFTPAKSVAESLKVN
jgi:hypothetical protein